MDSFNRTGDPSGCDFRWDFTEANINRNISDLVHGHQFSGAFGRSHITMSNDVAGADSVVGFQCFDEPFEGTQLFGTGGVVFEISDEADPDTTLVVNWVCTSGMGSLNLLLPAKSRFHIAVGHAFSITDDEVVTNSQPGVSVRIFLFQMSFVDRLHTS